MKKVTVMIVGLGDLAWWVLEFLARIEGPIEIITADYNVELGRKRTNSALLGAFQMGYNPSLKFVELDLNNVEQSAEILRRHSPDIIYNSTTLQSWWVLAELPREAYERLDKARYGPWLPMHLLLTYKLMQAVKLAGINTKVVNAAFPDAVHPVLSKIGLTPLVGIGNIDNLIPSLTHLAADQLKVKPRRVQIFMLAPHFVSYYIARFGEAGGAPYYLKCLLDDKDVTSQLDISSLLQGIPDRYRRPGGRGSHPLVASSVLRIVCSLMNDTAAISHAPGPNGLPGGYPVRVSSGGVEVIVPEGLSLEESIRINEEGQKFDGIEKINEDGSVIFTDASYSAMKEVLGYDCKTMKIEECQERVKELNALFEAYCASFR